MSDLVEKMFSFDSTGENRNVWWANPDGTHKHDGTGFAVFLKEAPNSEEAMRILGPAFAPVEMRAVATQQILDDSCAYGWQVSEKHKACVRTSDGKVFGIFSPQFVPVQPRNAFRITDDLLGAGCVYETGGTLKDGAVQWILATLPEAIRIGGETYKPYLLARNAHDGSMSFVIQFAVTRVVCANTLDAAMGEDKGAEFRCRHSGDPAKRIEEARSILRLGHERVQRFQVTAEELLGRSFTFKEYQNLVGMLLPKPEADATDRIRTNWQNQLANIVSEWNAPDMENIKGTAWGALQAVASYSDHTLALSRGSAASKGARQFTNAFDDASGLKAKAFALLAQ